MDTVIDAFCRLIEGLIALLLAVMVVLVFGNVVLRYAFNSGISFSEEVSRWLFVWLTFLGFLLGAMALGIPIA
jgi:TRAP-type C4-dicarboxylate transport system permease small subunit